MAVGYDQLMAVLDADRVVVEQGDMVCLHTGFARLPAGDGPQAGPAATGHGLRGAGRPRPATAAVDHRQRPGGAGRRQLCRGGASGRVSHSGCCAALPLHEHCLFKLGVHLGEIWHLAPLADWLREHGRYRFLLTAPPLRLPGAVGSPATPVGTV